MQHEDLTRRIITAAIKVHSTLGGGFQEVIHRRTLGIEFPYHIFAFERGEEMSIFYRGNEIGTRRMGSCLHLLDHSYTRGHYGYNYS